MASLDGEDWPTVSFWKLCGCHWQMDPTGLVLFVTVCPEAAPQPIHDPNQYKLIS